ncbi:MAG: hypothetical protein ABIF71_09065 [Planctomycetota bacterium]
MTCAPIRIQFNAVLGIQFPPTFGTPPEEDEGQMSIFRKYWIEAILIAVAVGVVVIGLSARNKDGQSAPQSRRSNPSVNTQSSLVSQDERSSHSQVDQNKETALKTQQVGLTSDQAATQKSESGVFDTYPETPANHKEGIAAVNMTEEERIAKYFTYDEKYYGTIDYNRVQQTRPVKPGENLVPIKIVHGGYQYTIKGQAAPKTIEAKVPPGMPCTFYAQDYGGFIENNKNIITIKADDQGIARVHYICSETGGGSMIIAHSPEASGWARIQVVGLSEDEYKRLKKEKPELFAE